MLRIGGQMTQICNCAQPLQTQDFQLKDFLISIGELSEKKLMNFFPLGEYTSIKQMK